jgi:hypothetical protein
MKRTRLSSSVPQKLGHVGAARRLYSLVDLLRNWESALVQDGT